MFIQTVTMLLNPDSESSSKTWRGSVSVPGSYFPSGVDKFNLYGIHNVRKDIAKKVENSRGIVEQNAASWSSRIYEALFPVPGSEPNFHRIHNFGSIDCLGDPSRSSRRPNKTVLSSPDEKDIAKEEEESDVWKDF